MTSELAINLSRVVGQLKTLEIEVQQLHEQIADLRALLVAECAARRQVDEHIWDRLNGEHSVKA